MTTGYSILRLVVQPGTTLLPARQLVIKSGNVPGPPGPQGPAGEPGLGVNAGYTHNQAVASDFWTIDHNLGYRPAVTSYDTADDQIIGNVDHVTANSLTIEFTTAVSGVAYMS